MNTQSISTGTWVGRPQMGDLINFCLAEQLDKSESMNVRMLLHGDSAMSKSATLIPPNPIRVQLRSVVERVFFVHQRQRHVFESQWRRRAAGFDWFCFLCGSKAKASCVLFWIFQVTKTNGWINTLAQPPETKPMVGKDKSNCWFSFCSVGQAVMVCCLQQWVLWAQCLLWGSAGPLISDLLLFKHSLPSLIRTTPRRSALQLRDG